MKSKKNRIFQNLCFLLFASTLFHACKKKTDINIFTGNITIVKTHDRKMNWSLISEYSYIQLRTNNVFVVNYSIRNGSINSDQTEINEVNVGNYFILFSDCVGYVNEKAVQVTSGKTVTVDEL